MADSLFVSDQRRKALIAAGVPLTLLLLLYVAWGISALVSGDQVARNVSAAGVELGGLDEADVESVGSDLNDALTTEPATLKVGDQLLDTNLFEIGVRVDSGQLVDDAMDARKGGSVLTQPFRWLGSFFSDKEIPVTRIVDDDAASRAAEALVEGRLAEPTDPYFDVTDAGIVVVPGTDGSTIAFDRVGAGVEAALDVGAPYVIEVEPLPLSPSLETDALQVVADEANSATSEPIEISVLSQTVVVEPAQLRSWILLANDLTTPGWALDNTSLINELRPLFTGLGDENQQAHFEIIDGKPVIVPPSESVICCDDDSADRVKSALLGPLPDPAEDADPEEPVLRAVELAPIVTGSNDSVAELEALGIVEQVSTFTTEHACCQGRVENIQRMAAIVQGYVIPPGGLFDLNEIVGRRTREKGFVAAGAIADGVLEDQVGGGVSQFTTTMFNAAFFAGMEFVEYQAHSIYFSRYPRGREATISFPKPDFIVRNDTDYGILVWPTWTNTSISVTLYSTKNIQVEDLGRSESAQGACTRVTTTRQRTYADGTVDRDTVFAVYRPGEGFDCNGNSTRPTTTTTAPEATTTTEGSTTESTAPATTATTAPATTATTAPATTATTAPTTTAATTTTAAG